MGVSSCLGVITSAVSLKAPEGTLQREMVLGSKSGLFLWAYR